MDTLNVVYESRPLRRDLDITTKTLVEVMNSVAVEQGSHWSFAGGFARDLYLGTSWNDYDICILNLHLVKENLQKMGLLEIGRQERDEIPHDYYVDPYDFSRKKYPIHWIQADNPWAFAPVHFDFSINQICLKSDGLFYAPTYAWKDLDKRIIRKVACRMSGNLALRAIRFAAKYDYSIHSDLEEEMKNYLSTTKIGTDILLNNVKKMVEDEVGIKAFKMMQRRHFPHIEDCTSIEQYMKALNDLIVSGQGYREPAGTRYNHW